MKIKRTTKIAFAFAVFIIAAALSVIWYGNHKALNDVKEYKQTGKSKYEYQKQEILNNSNIQIDYED
ncbi:MAG: hypothetical protein LBR28_07250 [Bacteroidales bacterium]|jgi:hypothetical protein|nr:hypothetical protein [Bacteroidales bacterium]